MSFATDIEKAAGGEPILAVVIGNPCSGIMGAGDIQADKMHTPIPWSEARPLLDYDYDLGTGHADCHAVTAWTPERVIFVRGEDGWAEVAWLPRNPTDHHPHMDGILAASMRA